VAKPINVYEFSLLTDEPVRVRVNCRDPTKLKGFMETFFDSIGYEIKFLAFCSFGKGQHRGNDPPCKRNSHDKQGGSSGKDRNKCRDNFRRRESVSSDRQLEKNFASQGDSQEDSMEDRIRDGSPKNEIGPIDITIEEGEPNSLEYVLIEEEYVALESQQSLLSQEE
jgi:hypothetical protein